MGEHPRKKERYEKTEEEEERTIPVNYFDSLRLREICDTRSSRKFPNIFRDYHVQSYDPVVYGSAPSFVIAGDIIFVIYKSFYLIPFLRDEEFSPLTDKHGSSVIFTMDIQFACYNTNNNSLITVVNDPQLEWNSIVVLKIKSTKEGFTIVKRNIFPRDNGQILVWDFDIPNCRGMIYNGKESLFKIFELKNYAKLFAIANRGGDPFDSRLRFGSPGNADFLVVRLDKRIAKEEGLLRIYSKHTGKLRKRIYIPVFPRQLIGCVELCGTDRIIWQQLNSGMQILDISGEVAKIIKTTDIEMLGCPYYLYKRKLFICHTQMRGVISLHVFNLEGEILLTFQDHRICMPNLYFGSYITNAQDIVISVCHDQENMYEPSRSEMLTINISSIFTGKCIAKITAGASNCSDIRKLALRFLVPWAFAYDEKTHELFTGCRLGRIYKWSNKFYDDVLIDCSYSPIYSSDEFAGESSSRDEEDDNPSDNSAEEDDDDA